MLTCVIKEVAQKYEHTISDLKSQLRSYEKQAVELEILNAKYDKVVEENRLMQQTIDFLMAQNEGNNRGAQDRMLGHLTESMPQKDIKKNGRDLKGLCRCNWGFYSFT